MKVGMVGTHYPRASYREEFISRMHQVAEVFRRTPGCLSAECWVSTVGAEVISIVQWESEEAFAAGYAAITAAGLDVAYDARESQPREILRLVSA